MKKGFFYNIGISPGITLVFFLLHLPLGMILKNSPAFLAPIFGGSVFFIGCLAALRGNPITVSCIISYLAGAEVLLRMTYGGGAGLFWEFGKYSVSAILFLAMLVKRGMVKKKNRGLSLYFLLLLPAAIFTPFDSFTEWRNSVSFNLSGPLSLVVCGFFFSSLELNRTDLQRMFSWLIAPIVSVAFIALRAIREVSDADVIWGTTSSFIASGGFGPNQVSSILGFGALICYLLFILTKGRSWLKAGFVVLIVWFFVQAVLTFSRGGVINAILPIATFLLILVKNRRQKFIALSITVFLVITGCYLVPWLNELTEGKLYARYSRTEGLKYLEVPDTTKRLELILADIASFPSNLLGKGIGRSAMLHDEEIGLFIGTHTEFSRMIGEHGIFGLLALFCLCLWVLKRYKSMRGSLDRAIAASLIVYFSFYQFHSAMRLVMPSYVIGFLGADFCLEKEGMTD